MFGGDKNKITIFGQSAGSWSVSAQVLSPLSKGLFRRAIMESGADFQFKNMTLSKSANEALQEAKQLAKHFNCSDDHKWLECLRGIDAQEFISEKSPSPTGATEFLPLSAQQTFKGNNYSKGRYLCSTPVYHSFHIRSLE